MFNLYFFQIFILIVIVLIFSNNLTKFILNNAYYLKYVVCKKVKSVIANLSVLCSCESYKLFPLVQNYSYYVFPFIKKYKQVKSSNITLKPMDPTLIIVTLIKENRIEEASALGYDLENFVRAKLREQMSFSDIIEAALDEKGWILTSTHINYIAEVFLKDTASLNLGEGFTLAQNLNELNDLDSFYFFTGRLKINAFVPESDRDVAIQPLISKASSPPKLTHDKAPPPNPEDLPGPDDLVQEVKTIWDFIAENSIFSITVGLYITSWLLYSVYYYYNKKHDISNKTEELQNISSEEETIAMKHKVNPESSVVENIDDLS